MLKFSRGIYKIIKFYKIKLNRRTQEENYEKVNHCCINGIKYNVSGSPEMPDMQAQMEKADKIENYRAKKDVAWHKTEYNKVLKYLNKTRK